MIKIAICDDDKIFLEKMKKYVGEAFGKHTSDYRIITYSNSVLFSNENQNYGFNVLFLDIDMPNKSGFDLAKELRSNFSNCFIIFVTTYAELVYKSLDFQPFHFIRKNDTTLLKQNVSEVVERLMEFMKQNKKLVLEDSELGRISFHYRDISYIESDNHNLVFYIQTQEEPIRIRSTINEISEEYEKMDFVRIHRSSIINLRYLSRIDMKIGAVYVNFKNRIVRLSVGKKYLSNLDEKYTAYLRATL